MLFQIRMRKTLPDIEKWKKKTTISAKNVEKSAGGKAHVLCPERSRDTLHLGGIPTKPPVAQQDKVESCHMTPAWHLQLLE